MFFIYLLTNKKNGKQYVGRNSRFETLEDLKNRYEKEMKGRRRKINQAMIEFGIDNFKFEIVEKPSSFEALVEAEKRWASKLNSYWPNGYNIGKCGMGWGWLNPEKTKKKISRSLKGKPLSAEHRKKISKLFKGKPLSDEHKEKIRQAHLGKKKSKEMRMKLSLSRKDNPKFMGANHWMHKRGLSRRQLVKQ